MSANFELVAVHLMNNEYSKSSDPPMETECVKILYEVIFKILTYIQSRGGVGRYDIIT